MKAFHETAVDRRKLIGTMLLGGAVLTLPACATTGQWSLLDAIRQLLYVSSTRAFARLTADGGFWDQNVGQLGLDGVLGNRGGVLASILTSQLMKGRLERAFSGVAERASYRAAPLVTDAVRVIGVQNALALVRGDPTAATAFLRGEMGNALVEAMVPEVGQAMRVAQDPVMGQLLAALTGVDVGFVANTFSNRVNDVIWNEIGAEEAAIRADPRATNDPLLIGVFGVGARL
ncbi:MAG: DUF4197 domain-containing protein [Alteraurantiacibacter sp.]